MKEKTRQDNMEARNAMEKKGVKFILPGENDLKSFTEKIIFAKQDIENKNILTFGIVSRIEELVRKYRASRAP